MADYIDRETVINAIFDNLWMDCPERCWELERNGTLNEVNDIVYALPSADVEPVVRCKDCHFFESDHWETVNGVPLIVAHNICTRWGGGCRTAEDGFCFMAIRSQGARMDGDANDE